MRSGATVHRRRHVPDDGMGHRKAQELQERFQGLSQGSEGYPTFCHLILASTF